MAVLPGLENRAQWAKQGAVLGVAATAGWSLGLLGLAGQHAAWLSGIAVMLSISGPAALIGAGFGLRWRRWLQRDAKAVSVRRWLRRMALDGALAAGGSAALTAVAVGWLTRTDPKLVLEGALMLGGLAAPTGAILLSAIGLPWVLRMVRGRAPWGPVVVASLVGAPMFYFMLVVAQAAFGGR